MYIPTYDAVDGGLTKRALTAFMKLCTEKVGTTKGAVDVLRKGTELFFEAVAEMTELMVSAVVKMKK